MPDSIISKAGEQFLTGGAGAGYALALLFACAIIWLVNRLLKSQDALIAAKDEHRADVTKYAALSESLKNAMNSMVENNKSILDAYRDERRRQ